MIFDSCPNCNSKLIFFNFNCSYGRDLVFQQEYLCQNCDFCSYTFTDQKDMIRRIKEIYNKEPKVNFYVTCLDQIIVDYENIQLLKQAEPVEQIQQDLNKIYDLKLDNIVGFDDIKRLMRDVINVKDAKKVHLCILGYQGTAKTVFLLSALEELTPQGLKCDYLDCSNLTGSGLLDYILTAYVDEKRTMDLLLLDEIDKTDIDDQKKFLNVLQTGIAKNLKRYDKRSAKVSITAIATANDINKIYPPLLDRFTSVYVPKYTKEQFFTIGDIVLKKKFQFSEYVSKTMLLKIWQVDGSMRRLDDLARLLKLQNTDQLKVDKFNDIITTLINRKLPNLT